MWSTHKSIVLIVVVTAAILLSGCIYMMPDMSKVSLVPNMMPGQPTMVVPSKDAGTTQPIVTPLPSNTITIPDGAPWYVGRYVVTSTGVVRISNGVPSGTLSPGDVGNKDIILNADMMCTSSRVACIYTIDGDRLLISFNGADYPVNYFISDTEITNDTNLGFNDVMVWTKQ